MMKFVLKMMNNGMPGVISETSTYYWDVIYRTIEAAAFDHIFDSIPEFSSYLDEGMIRVLYIEPLKEPALTLCSPEPGSLRMLIGDRPGRMMSRDLPGAVIYYGENAKSTNLMLNRGVKCDGITYDVLSGPLVITGITEEGKIMELDKDTMIRAYEMFERPELFYYDRNRVCPVKCSSRTASVMRENNISIIS